MSTPPTPAGPDPRAGRIVFGACLVVVAVGLTYLGVAPQHWLRGVLVVSGGLASAGVVRLFLTDARSGPLLVRGRWFDAATFVVAGVLVATFGFLVR